MVQHEICDWIDPEAVEHPEADLRMPLEHEPLGVGERARLLQDLLRNGELAEVVQAGGEARQFDLLGVEAESHRDAGGQFAHPLRMEARVGVAGIDRFRERGGGPVARGPVGAGGEALELRQLDHIGPVQADTIFAVFLRPVEGAVGEPDQLVAAVALNGERRDAGTDRDGADVLEVHGRDPLDDRGRGRERCLFVVVDEQQRELVAAETERLAALPQPRRHL